MIGSHVTTGLTLVLVDHPADAAELAKVLGPDAVATFAAVPAPDDNELVNLVDLRDVLGILPGDADRSLTSRATEAADRARPLAESVRLVSCPAWPSDRRLSLPPALGTANAVLVWLGLLPEWMPREDPRRNGKHQTDTTIGSNEAPDDPHRLARVYLSASCRHEDGLTLRYWRGESLRWDGAFRSILDKDLNADLGVAIKAEFDRLNARETEAWQAAQNPAAKPTARKVTNNLVGNVALALRGYTLLDARIESPAWLCDDPPFPADEVLPMRNALVHLPGLITEADAIRTPTPLFFCPYVLDYNFELNAPEPINWLTFLGARPVTAQSHVRLQLWPDDPQSISTLQEWFGYLLLPDTRLEKILALIGPRRSGKGTIGRVLRRLIGPENVAGPTLSGLAGPFGLAPLIGKPAAVISDARLSGRSDQAVIVERLLSVSGEDALTIDRKHLPSWTGKLPTRFAIISNELLRLSDSSGALAGRLILLRLTESFHGRENEALTDVLARELPGILLWAIEGWRRLHERGHFLQPDSGAELAEELEDLASPIGAFLKERCLVEPGQDVMAARLYAAWKEWCTEKGRDHSGDEQRFGRDLRAVFPALKVCQHRLNDGTRKRFYEGIGLAADCSF